MFVLGLTGSIGMGKSTAAQVLRDYGVPVHDADEVVHALLEPAGAAEAKVKTLFPSAVQDGAINRQRLGEIVFADGSELKRLEAVLHPLVRRSEERFLRRHRQSGEPLVVLDIPLLFEVGAEQRVDAVLLVTAPAEVQRERVLKRVGMTEKRFEQIQTRQLRDAEKRLRAQYVVSTDGPHSYTARQLRKIVDSLRAQSSARHRLGHGDDRP